MDALARPRPRRHGALRPARAGARPGAERPAVAPQRRRRRPGLVPARRVGALRLESPPVRAAFLFDDPNLRWRSYGFIDYRELARPRRRARLPRRDGDDPAGRRASAPADGVALQRRRDRLSLVFHGNDHVKKELLRPREPDDALAMAAQAMRRIERFERAHRPGRRPSHDAAARSLLGERHAGARRRGVRRPVRDPPDPVDRGAAAVGGARRLGAGGLRRWLRRDPTPDARLQRRGDRPARVPGPPDRALRAPRRPRARARAARRGRRAREPPAATCGGWRWATWRWPITRSA